LAVSLRHVILVLSVAAVSSAAGQASRACDPAVPDSLPEVSVTEIPEEFPIQTAELLRPFQGSWDARQFGSTAWTIEIRGQRFRGVVGADEWYEGTIRLRRDRDPMQIDFMIEDCRCSYRGMTSKAIFRETADSILVAAPQPGRPRPAKLDANDGQTVELKRVSTPGPEDAEHR